MYSICITYSGEKKLMNYLNSAKLLLGIIFVVLKTFHEYNSEISCWVRGGSQNDTVILLDSEVNWTLVSKFVYFGVIIKFFFLSFFLKSLLSPSFLFLTYIIVNCVKFNLLVVERMEIEGLQYFMNQFGCRFRWCMHFRGFLYSAFFHIS